MITIALYQKLFLTLPDAIGIKKSEGPPLFGGAPIILRGPYNPTRPGAPPNKGGPSLFFDSYGIMKGQEQLFV